MKMQDRVLRRSVVSLLLVLVAGGVWWFVQPDPKTWLVSVSSGLIVLGIAGIWVSFFAEIQAGEQIKSDIDSRFSVLKTILQAKINDAYFDESYRDKCTCREEARFRQRLLHEIGVCQSEIRILAVAGREFLHAGDGFAYHALESFLERRGTTTPDSQPILRVALVHPLSESAVSRAFREDNRFSDFCDYGSTRLWSDVIQSYKTLAHWAAADHRAQARAYKVAPFCFLIFVNDFVFVEQYHFGSRRERASGKVPIFVVTRGSLFYEQLEGHFEHVWKTARGLAINREFIEGLDPNSDEFKRFIEYIYPELTNLACTNFPEDHTPR